MLERINELYKQYISDPMYVYKCHEHWIIIMKKITGSFLFRTAATITDESRAVSDKSTAKYLADKLLVILIFNKHNPVETCDMITSIRLMTKHERYKFQNQTYKVGNIVGTELSEGHYLSTVGIQYFKNINVAYFLNKIDGYTGKRITYYEDGEILKDRQYYNGKKNGDYMHYYNTGKLIEKRSYVNGILGERIAYYFQDLREAKWLYNQSDDKYTGYTKYISYYTNGQISHEYQQIGDKYIGRYTGYSYHGIITVDGEFVDGLKVGRWIEDYYGSRDEGEYIDGKRTGKWRETNRDDRYYTYFEGNYIDGKQTGEWVFFTSTNILLKKCEYFDGKLSGMWNTYYLNGMNREIGQYINNKKTGKWKIYTAGKSTDTIGEYIVEEGDYDNDVKVGKWIEYKYYNRSSK